MASIKSSFAQEEMRIIRTDLVRWYEANRRMLPWRGDQLTDSDQKSTIGAVPERSAYGVWVSEVMLQQTQVATVIPYWMKWMARFPDVKTLAAASSDDVNALWAGLGYYRRCQFLLKGAKKVCDELAGELPETPAELVKIPGIGPYTAGAISSIYFGKNVPIVDGNVIRVFSRLRALEKEVGPALEKECWSLAGALVEGVENPASFNQGLMELGATVCTPKSPSCSQCPLSVVCMAKRNEDAAVTAAGLVDIESLRMGDNAINSIRVTSYPRKPIKKRQREVLLSVGVFAMEHTSEPQGEGGVRDSDAAKHKKFLFVRRPKDGLLANQWEFPSVIIWEESLEDVKVKNPNTKTKAENLQESTPDFTDDELWGPLSAYLDKILGFGYVGASAPSDEWVAQSLASSSSSPTSPGDCGGQYLRLLSRSRAKQSVQHLFSHQRHTMMVTSCTVEYGSWGDGESVKQPLEWLTSCASGLQVKWMSAEEIRAAGITTGMDKVLKKVLAPAGAPASATKKRKAKDSAPLLGKDQPKLSSFFAAAPKKTI